MGDEPESAFSTFVNGIKYYLCLFLSLGFMLLITTHPDRISLAKKSRLVQPSLEDNMLEQCLQGVWREGNVVISEDTSLRNGMKN